MSKFRKKQFFNLLILMLNFFIAIALLSYLEHRSWIQVADAAITGIAGLVIQGAIMMKVMNTQTNKKRSHEENHEQSLDMNKDTSVK